MGRGVGAWVDIFLLGWGVVRWGFGLRDGRGSRGGGGGLYGLWVFRQWEFEIEILWTVEVLWSLTY